MVGPLSTARLLTQQTAERQHKHAVYLTAEPFLENFATRFAHMLETCGLDRARFARMLSGSGQQKITNWLDRGRIGSPSRREVFLLTGASLDWLNDGIGQPFPAGPQKLYPRILEMEAPPTYAPTTTIEVTPRELALLENYRASPERFRQVVDDQAAASAKPDDVNDGAG
ncbi:MAG: hypothetical protein KAY54_08815 [Burkholderiaceae bacterium]|nr:hypothetical protein [Burkholderiaceae bacterium]